MFDDPDLSGLLEPTWTPSHWHLLWFFAAPVIWYLARWAYREFITPPAEAWVHEQPESDILKPRPGEPGLPATPRLTPARVFELFNRYEGQWGIAGGWAIDLHLGRTTREHQDLEIAVLRRDQSLLWQYLIGWSPSYRIHGANGELQPWRSGELLHPPVHELVAEAPQWDVGQMEILLNEAEETDWVYRRDPRLRLPLKRAFLRTSQGIPYLAPEIVLLYKSKQPRPQDEADFSISHASLPSEAREWLKLALACTSPGHPWLERLG